MFKSSTHIARLSFAALVAVTGCTVAPDDAHHGSGTAAQTSGPLIVRELEIASTPTARLFVRAVGGHDGGPTIVFIHGGPGISSPYLTGFERLATSKLRVVTYDQRGVHRSTAGSTDTFLLDDHVKDLDAIRAALGNASLHIVGHSWGGAVAQSYAIAHPDRVASLTLLASVPPTSIALKAGNVRANARIRALTDAGILPAPVPKGHEGCAPIFRKLPAYNHDPAFTLPPEFGGIRCGPGGGIIPASFDWRPGLAGFGGPVFVAIGASDLFGAELVDEAVAAFPAADVSSFVAPACGHFPWAECPGSFNPAFEAFLTTHARLDLGAGSGRAGSTER